MSSRFADVQRKIPQSQHSRMDAALDRFCRERSGKSADVDYVRFVTGRRRAFVFEVGIRIQRQQFRYFLKFAVNMSDRQVEYITSEAIKTQQVYDAMGSSGTFQSVQPAAYYEDLACLFLQGVEGRRLDLIILRAVRPAAGKNSYIDAERYSQLAARWLHDFHERMPLSGDKEYATDESVIARAEREIITLHLSDPVRFSGTTCRKLRDRFQAYLEHFQRGDFKLGMRHNDFAPWNIICFDGQVCVLDFADLATGAKCEDACQFEDAMHVLGNRIWSNTAKTLRLKNVFSSNCVAMSAVTAPASKYFRLLYLLTRTSAVINNTSGSLASKPRARFLLAKYEKEIALVLSSGLAD